MCNFIFSSKNKPFSSLFSQSADLQQTGSPVVRCVHTGIITFSRCSLWSLQLYIFHLHHICASKRESNICSAKQEEQVSSVREPEEGCGRRASVLPGTASQIDGFRQCWGSAPGFVFIQDYTLFHPDAHKLWGCFLFSLQTIMNISVSYQMSDLNQDSLGFIVSKDTSVSYPDDKEKQNTVRLENRQQ